MRARSIVRLAVLVATAGLVVVGWLSLTPTAAVSQGPLVVEIPPRQGLLSIARRLRQADIVRSRAVFVIVTVARGVPRGLKAGEYEVPRGASTWDVVSLLASGRVRQHAILHPEGATVFELARALEADRLAAAESVLRVATDRRFLQEHGIEAPSVEGYLFPDTYQLVRGMTPEEILGRMVARLRSKITPEVQARARARGLTLNELLTLASIIEREAVVKDEQRVISGVFWNRLRVGMPLQADPTVQYAVGRERQTLTRADLATDHPYNTYVRAGLPPGPIASPGLPAIEAALDPAPVKYLYFVARDDMRHQFSTTVEQHNQAVTRYRMSRR